MTSLMSVVRRFASGGLNTLCSVVATKSRGLCSLLCLEKNGEEKK